MNHSRFLPAAKAPGVSLFTRISYFPYFKLGVAYYELGQWDAALQAFETEERLGAISRSGEELSELRRYRELDEGTRDAAATEVRARMSTF